MSIKLKIPEPGDPRYTFVEWLLTPPSERSPRTQAELAEQLGRDSTAMSQWKKEPGVQKLLEQRMQEMNIGLDKVQQVVEALHKEGARGDVQAAKAYMAYVESLRPTVVKLEDPDVQAMSEEDIDIELRFLLDG